MVMVGRCWKLLSILGLCSSHLLLILLSNSTCSLWEQLSHSTVFCCMSKIHTAIAVYSMHIYNFINGHIVYFS
ncbi:hypothetical protein BGY98DRAFT_671636 [Russula aff. rugulosa BPL654]|nr:hypothetical protein BGY98DRAFT_671636 [Russula aff. rugulosa BPL654]